MNKAKLLDIVNVDRIPSISSAHETITKATVAAGGMYWATIGGKKIPRK